MVDRYMDIVEESGGHGIQVEFVSELRDSHGAAIHGYEAPMVEEYRQRYGQSPSRLLNHDPEWLRFRAGFVHRGPSGAAPPHDGPASGSPRHDCRHRPGSGGASRRPLSGRLPGSPRLARRVVDGRTLPLVPDHLGRGAGGTLHEPVVGIDPGPMSSDRGAVLLPRRPVSRTPS